MTKVWTCGSSQKGSVLLEGLIAILIFSMGILALVGMQANTINIVSDAKYRADSSFLANKVIGQMWVNRPNLNSYACGPCTSSNGNADTQELVTQMSAVGTMPLPGASATITRTGTQLTVTINWTPRGGAAHRHIAITNVANPT
ncbi:MAG: hypothetical protein H7X91_12270 [Burkholderiales bacterium]|nr:hypothetical protein [Burkholderiales bacterium]